MTDLTKLSPEALLRLMDGSSSQIDMAVVGPLRKMPEYPRMLLEKYRASTKASDRHLCVYRALWCAQTSPAAFELGIEALRDRSKMVRYRACELLACSQKKEALPILAAALSTAKGDADSMDIRAAMDAIESENHNYFVDRTHSGRMKLDVL